MTTVVLVALDVVLVLAVSRALRVVLERLGQPAVMAEVCAGLLLGASVLGALPGDPAAALFTADARKALVVLGQVALVAYVFGVGADLDPAAVRREGRTVGLVAVASFALPFVAGAVLAAGIHDRVAGDPPFVPFVVFLGTAMAVTAFPVLARIVDARGLTARRSGRVALGAAAAQELLVWPMLAVAVALAADGRSPLAVVGLGTASLGLVVVLARAVLPRVRGTLHGPAVVAALAVSAVGTELAGLHLVLGAFLFSVVVPRAERDAGLAVLRSAPLRVAGVLFLPLFFALPAMRVDLGALGADGLGLFALVLAVAVAAKLLSATAAARAAGLRRDEARTVGVLMNARGLVELVVLSVGLDARLIDARLFAVMVLMALATTFATGPLVGRVATGRRRARRPRGAARVPPPVR